MTNSLAGMSDNTGMPQRKDSPIDTPKTQDTDSPSQPLYIAVMGVTGAGKSHLIKRMTKNNDVVVSDSQLSCKYTISIWKGDKG
jgi:predicted GTPase